MKRILTFLAVVTLCLAFGGVAGADVVNGGFEDGFNGWTFTPNGSSSGAYQTDGTITSPHEGDYFAGLTGGAGDTGGTLSQAVYVPAGGKISGWAAYDYRDTGSPYADPSSVMVDSTQVWSQSYAAVGWTYWEWTAPASGNYTLTLSSINTSDGNYPSLGGFDGITSTAVPLPPAALLLGSGLLGLMGFRRFRK